MSLLKTVLLLLLLASGGNALAQRADTLGYRMLDSSDADNIPGDSPVVNEYDTASLNIPEESLEDMDEEDMTQEDKLRYGVIEHSLYDRQPIDGFDEGAQMRLTPRQPDSAAMAAIRNDAAFKYPPLDAQKERWPQWVKDIAAWASANLRMIRNVMFGVLGLLLLVSVILFMNKNDIPVFRWRSRRKAEVQEETEAISQSDLEAMAVAAGNAGQLRDAVRFRYLHSLQLLENNGLIVRSKDKTNMDYLRELARTAFHPSFAAITLQYEYVWYGHMPLSEAQFWRVNEAFEAFKKSLSK